jgi:lipopolysaccharide export system permease protein
MSAAGVPPMRLLRPFLMLAAFVCVLVSVMTLYVMPASFQELRDLVQKIRGDFIANVVKEGQFTALDNGITFHFRERSPGGVLLGIFMQDRREQERPVVYLAERGQTFDVNGQSYLVLEQGSVHRQQAKSRDSSIVAFERYALDLAAFNQDGGDLVYKPRERATTQLVFPKEDDAYYRMQSGRFRAELHDRLSGWLYPLAMMLIAFAALGDARTTRQGRGLAVASAVLAVVTLRIAGFAASSAAVRSPVGVIWVYVAPLTAIVVAGVIAIEGPRARTYGTRAAQVAAAVISRLIPAQLRPRGA